MKIYNSNCFRQLLLQIILPMSILTLDCHPFPFSLLPTSAITTDINRFSKRFTIAKHVQYCCRKLAFRIGIASSFTIGPLDSINRASSHLRRSTFGRTVRFSPSLVSPRRSRCRRLSLSFPLTRPPPLVRPSSKLTPLPLSSQSGELGRRIGSSIRFLLWGCRRVQNFPRQHACTRERRNGAIGSERVDRRETQMVEGEMTRIEERGDESDAPESRVRKMGWMRWLRHGGAREQEIGDALL